MYKIISLGTDIIPFIIKDGIVYINIDYPW